MFERYSISVEAKEVSTIFSVDTTEGYQSVNNAHPTSLMPVITDADPKGLSFFYWGMPPDWSRNKSVSKKLINANVEELNTRKTYRDQLNSRRCVIPADGLYGWKKISKKGKVPYRFFQNNKSLFRMAGLWDQFDSPDGSIEHVFTVITHKEDGDLAFAFDDLPILLSEKDSEIWLDRSSSEEMLLDILQNSQNSGFGNFPVTNRVNDPTYQGADLLKPAPAIDQFGNYSLFD